MSSATQDFSHHLRVGVLGAFVFAVIFALLWTTAAMGALPEANRILFEAFGPNQTAITLIEGLFWSGVIGSLICFVLSIAYGFARNSMRRG